MPVRMDWVNNERTAIFVSFEGKWEIGDMRRMITKGISMLDCVNHSVDTIFDFTNSTASPQNLFSIVDQLASLRIPKQRLVILVNPNSYIKSLTNVARLLAPRVFAHLYFVNNVEAAKSLIAQHAETVLTESVR